MTRQRLRPCPNCGAPRRTSCGRCGWQPHRSPSSQQTYAERKRRKQAVDEHLAAHGPICPGYKRDAHTVDPTDLTAEHIIGVAEAGSHDSPLAVTCRSCNGRRGADQARESGQGR